MNNYCATGNLTGEPEFFENENVTTASATLAVNSYFTDKQTGEKKQKTLFIDIKAFGNKAKNMREYLIKGSKIAVNGRLDTEEWTDKDTQKPRSKIVCIVNEIEYLNNKKLENEADQNI